METQIKALYRSPSGIKTVTIFGYATKGVPSLEINGVGKLSKNIKEKLIYLTRIRRLKIPMRRFVICVDQNELIDMSSQSIKWLEFPLLLLYWHLSGLVPIGKLDDCMTSGWIKTNGDINHLRLPKDFENIIKRDLNSLELENIKLVGLRKDSVSQVICSNELLEHIPNLNYYIESDSAIPM